MFFCLIGWCSRRKAGINQEAVENERFGQEWYKGKLLPFQDPGLVLNTFPPRLSLLERKHVF